MRHNYAQAWTKAETSDTFGALRGEYDIDDSLMVYGAVGARKSNHDFLRHNVSITNAAGDFTIQPRDFTRDEDVRTVNAGVRKWFQTGPVSHELNLAADYFSMDFENGGGRYANRAGNLYNPVTTPEPTVRTRTDSKIYTENRFSGVALSDTLGFLEDLSLIHI